MLGQPQGVAFYRLRYMKRLLTKKSIRLIIILLVIILLQISGILGWPGGLITRAVTPVFSYVYERSLTTKNWVDIYRQPNQLIELNQNLIQENAFLKDELQQRDQDKVENERLTTLLAYSERVQGKSIIAKVASRWDFGGETILTIDRGENDGVQVEDLVIDENGVLIGKISKTGRTLAHIQVMTHPDFKIAVKRSTEIAPLGILSGEFLITAKVELIPRDSDISVGEELFTTNLQGAIEGIRVGMVTEVNSKPGDLFKTAVVSPLYKLDRILFLQVMKNNND